MPTHEFIVEDLKIRLDRYLANQLSEVSRSHIQKDIEGGYVEVNGQVINESKFVVRLNDKIVYKENSDKRKESSLEPTNTPLKILYNNHGLLIIDKPAGLTVHPGAGFKGNTLASALLYQFQDIKLVGEEGRPGIVHRLDKDTSGVILVAKTQEMYEYLKNAFADRLIKKEYIALVRGHVEKPHGFIDTPIGRSKTDFRKYTTKNPVQEKESLTEYKVLEYLSAGHTTPSAAQPPLLSQEGNTAGTQSAVAPNSLPKIEPVQSAAWEGVPSTAGGGGMNGSVPANVDNYTLLLVKLHTGRTHQIRVHFSSLGHALMGDGLYGTKKNQINGLSRQFLHAKRIEVQLPDSTWIEAESEFPEDLKEVLVHLNSKVIKQL